MKFAQMAGELLEEIPLRRAVAGVASLRATIDHGFLLTLRRSDARFGEILRRLRDSVRNAGNYRIPSASRRPSATS
jgi:hypothetical protein